MHFWIYRFLSHKRENSILIQRPNLSSRKSLTLKKQIIVVVSYFVCFFCCCSGFFLLGLGGGWGHRLLERTVLKCREQKWGLGISAEINRVWCGSKVWGSLQITILRLLFWEFLKLWGIWQGYQPTLINKDSLRMRMIVKSPKGSFTSQAGANAQGVENPSSNVEPSPPVGVGTHWGWNQGLRTQVWAELVTSHHPMVTAGQQRQHSAPGQHDSIGLLNCTPLPGSFWPFPQAE